MAELTTDQRVASLLTPVLAQVQEASVASHSNAEAFRSRDRTNIADVHEVLEQRADEVVERLADLMEGLAAGAVFIVDERLLLEVAEGYIEDPNGMSPKHNADLMLDELKTRGVLR